MAILATEFTDKSGPFCVYGFMKNFSTFAGFLVASYNFMRNLLNRELRSSPPYVLMLIVLLPCVGGYFTSMLFPYSDVSNEDENEKPARELKEGLNILGD